MAQFQIKVGAHWNDGVELHVDSLAAVADELMDRIRSGNEIVAALPIITHLILQYHGGQFFDKDPNYIDFEMDIDFDSLKHDVVKASYTCAINMHKPGDEYIDRREHQGSISIM